MRTRMHVGFSLGMMLGGLVLVQTAWSKPVEVEIPVESAFAPIRGFDDNDNVQVVIHGMLPNTCYQVGRHELVREGQNSYRIRQFAVKNEEGVCLQEGQMPPHMQLSVPFTTEVSIGQLEMGDYRFDYVQSGQDPHDRSILVNVAHSKAPTIDSLPYANVSSMSISDLVDARKEVVVSFEGVLTSSCMDLDKENIKVEKIKDVYIVLPLVKIKSGVMCAQAIRPFKSEVSLGKLAEGHYLIHIRSMNGKAVNRVIESLIPIR